MKFDSMDIVRAMQIIADSNNSKLKLDKTITAQIDSIEDAETGEYMVRYEGNIFPAFSYDAKVTFNTDDNVYVKIPENDMSKRKIIEGRVSSLGNSLSDILEQQVEINLIEPSLDKFYGYDKDKTYGIVAGVAQSHPYFTQTIFQAPANATGDHFFQNYTRNYNKIKISGSFYTNFVGQHDKGNYGLIVTFRTQSGDNIGAISYRLDFSSFIGNPYSYTTPSPQSVIIDVFEQSIIGLDSILLFQENFETDKSLNYSQQIIYENKGEDNPPICNIFVKDIDISFCEVIDLKDTTYYLTIATPLGSVFSGITTSLSLDARLKFQGKNILSQNTCKCYWYKENLSIKKGDEKYDKLAGVRWEKINKQDEEYLPIITVKSEEIKSHAKYKVIVVYKEVTLSKEVEISQHNPEHDVQIRQQTRNNSRIVLEVVSKKNNDNRAYFGDWYFFLPDGSYDLIPGGENVPFIDVTDYLLYPTAKFYCQVYYNNEPICIVSHSFNISDSQDDLLLTYVGQDIYQYNADGDIAYEDTELDRTLGIQVEWKEGFGSAYTVSYLAPDGVELSNDRTKAHSPANSMMQNLWVDSTSILHYNIRQKYSLNCNNNIITVKIKCTSNGNEYIFYKEILFLKDGDQGTNGTTYICAIRPVDLKNGFKLNGFHALQYNNGWIDGGLNLRCYVYKNGDLINNQSGFNLTYKWECGSQTAARADKLRISTITGFTNQDDYRNIQGIGSLDVVGDYVVKVTITIRETSNSETTQIYCQYPIDIAVGGLDMQYINMNLPSYIKYTSSGINASFLNQELKCIYRGNELPIYPTNKTILDLKDKKLNPVQKFQYSGGIAALRCEVSSSMYLLHPVMMYLDTYGNEAINGWDGTKLQLDDNGKYILAPQIGAGKKNGDNTFTGVVMGLDTQQDHVGLYGYRYGIAHFGFKDDGTAFIGPSGGGQILFNGTKGTITSGNYTSSSGMQIDLQNGHIDSYNFKLSSGNMILDSANQKFDFTVGTSVNSRFLIRHVDGSNLFYAGRDAYYLQSQNFVSNSQGTRIDLANGRINSWNFIMQTSNMTLDSSQQKFDFKLGTANGSRFQIAVGDKNVFYVGPSNYYLQSVDYDASNNGTRIDLANGRIQSYNFRLYTPTIDLNSATGRFTFLVNNNDVNGAFRIQYSENGVTNTLFNASRNSYYLRSSNYSYNSQTNEVQGVYIDLQNGNFRAGGNAIFSGTITAKSGKIGGWNINENGLNNGSNIYLNSSGAFKSGENFSVTAGGNLTCKSANIAGNLSVDNLYIRQGNGSYYSALSSNSRGYNSISGDYVDCRGLFVRDGYGYTTFQVDSNGNVYISGRVIMGPGSSVSWNYVTGTEGLYQDIDEAKQAGKDAQQNLTTQMNYVNQFVKKFGYTSIDAMGISTPQLNAGWITTGLLSAQYIDFSGGYGGITTTGASTAPTALSLKGQAIRINSSYGDVFMSAPGCHIQCHAGGAVTISPRLEVNGIDIGQAISDLKSRVNALENK